MKKRYLTFFLVALLALGLTAKAYCYQAEVIDISNTKYFPAVKEAYQRRKNQFIW